jgi:heat shock protein HslJ
MPRTLALTLLLLATSCSVANGSSGALANSAWQVIAIDGQKASREARLAFAGNQLSASAGCNTISGGWRVQGKRLAARQLAATEMYCAAPLVMDQEAALATLLSSLPRFDVAGDTMRLRSGGHSAELRKQR